MFAAFFEAAVHQPSMHTCSSQVRMHLERANAGLFFEYVFGLSWVGVLQGEAWKAQHKLECKACAPLEAVRSQLDLSEASIMDLLLACRVLRRCRCVAPTDSFGLRTPASPLRDSCSLTHLPPTRPACHPVYPSTDRPYLIIIAKSSAPTQLPEREVAS
eukprot:2975323-Pyramimonas_sp.AAC.1